MKIFWHNFVTYVLHNLFKIHNLLRNILFMHSTNSKLN